MFITKRELKSKVPDIKGTTNAQIYFLNDTLLAKRFRGMSPSEKRDCLRRYECIDNMTALNNVSLPVDILETENGFCGWIEEIIPGTLDGKLSNYANYYNEHCYDITLDDITSYILNVCEIIDTCHKNGIINPDLSSEGNVLFNPSDRSVYVTDYQGMQVGDIQTKCISSFIDKDPIVYSKKYCNKGVWTPNIDIYTLAIRFFYYCTKINVPRAIKGNYSINDLLKMAGIYNTNFGDCMRVLYDENIDNLDIRNAIKELNEDYQLSAFRLGQVRNLVKKR